MKLAVIDTRVPIIALLPGVRDRSLAGNTLRPRLT